MTDRFDEVAEKVMGVDVLDEKWSDNLAVTLCTAFDDLPALPGTEEDESDTVWSASTNARYEFAKKAICGFIAQALRTVAREERERALREAAGIVWKKRERSIERAALREAAEAIEALIEQPNQ